MLACQPTFLKPDAYLLIGLQKGFTEIIVLNPDSQLNIATVTYLTLFS